MGERGFCSWFFSFSMSFVSFCPVSLCLFLFYLALTYLVVSAMEWRAWDVWGMSYEVV